MKRVHMRIRGKVQGVYYRQSAKAEADRLGVRGWVQNLEDGDVEAVAEAEEKALDGFIRWCHGGPPAARVQDIKLTYAPATGEFGGFEVRR